MVSELGINPEVWRWMRTGLQALQIADDYKQEYHQQFGEPGRPAQLIILTRMTLETDLFLHSQLRWEKSRRRCLSCLLKHSSGMAPRSFNRCYFSNPASKPQAPTQARSALKVPGQAQAGKQLNSAGRHQIPVQKHWVRKGERSIQRMCGIGCSTISLQVNTQI